MSNGKLIILGDVFRDPNPSSPTYGEPIRINIDPAGCYGWSDCNEKVFQKIRDTYGAWWNQIWAPFDLRTVGSAFSSDNDSTASDSIVEFPIIHYRYSASWGAAFQPLSGMSGWTGSLGGMDGIYTSLSFSNYQVGPKGFTATGGGLSATEVVEFYPHELSHCIYDSPHYMGGNSTPGNKFTRPCAGWGTMSGNFKTIFCANSFERWVLGWIDIKCNGTPTYFTQQSDLNGTYIYTLRDFLTNDDCIRIKIPNTTNRYLWIEFHKKIHMFDYKNSTGLNPSSGAGRTELIPDFDAGIYMYIEHLVPDRNNATYSATNMQYVNTFLPLNAQGNMDYVYTDTPKVVTHNSQMCLNPGYYWNNPTHTYKISIDNPISGTNPWFDFPDDYRVFADTDGDGYKQKTEDKNNVIKRTGNTINGCSGCEKVTIQCESNNSDYSHDIMTYNNTFGRNDEAIDSLSRRSDAFQVGDEVGLSGIIPILNYPDFSSANNRIEGYILNGISIKRLSDDANGNARVQISFEDYTVREDKRWCGYVNLMDNTSNSNSDLIIDTAVTLTIDKSGTPNRLTLLDGEFINYTVFTCKENSKFLQDINSTVDITNKSTLQLDTNSVYEVKSGATLNIESESDFIMQPGCTLLVRDNGTVFIEDSSYFHFNGGTITLEGTNSKLEIAGTLEIAENQTFTFNGSGYVKFSSPLTTSENIIAHPGTTIEFSGSGQTDKVIEIAQESLYIPDSVENFSIEDAMVYMQHNQARVAVLDTSDIYINNVKFTPQSANRTAHRGLQVFGQPNCIIDSCYFEKGEYGVFGYLTYNGSPLEITNSDFDDLEYGVWIHDKEIRLYNCGFTDCDYGTWAESMSFTNNEIEDGGYLENDYGVYYTGGSGANLYFNNTDIGWSTNYGMHCSGAFTTTIRCSDIYRNGTVGVSSGSSVYLNMNNNLSPQGGNSRIYNNTNENLTFFFPNYLNLSNGYNDFSKDNGALLMSGIFSGDCNARPPSFPATYNTWFIPTNGTPVNGTNYNLQIFGCNPAKYLGLTTSPLAAHVSCGGGGGTMVIGGGEELSTSEISTDPIQTALLNEDYQTAFNLYYNDLISPIVITGITTTQGRDFETIWEGMKYCFGKIRSQSAVQAGISSSNFNKLEQGLDKMKQLNTGNDKRLFLLKLEHATMYRAAGDFNTAMQMITDLRTNLSDIDEITETEYWLCTIQTEKDIKLGNIPQQDIVNYTHNCETTGSVKHQMMNNSVLTNKQTASDIILSVIPNPVTAQSVINVELSGKSTASVEIIDIDGKTVKSYNVSEQKISIGVRSSDLPKGIYTVKVLTSSGLTKTTRMIIQ